MPKTICTACHGSGYSDGGEVHPEADEDDPPEVEPEEEPAPPPKKPRKSFAEFLLSRSGGVS